MEKQKRSQPTRKESDASKRTQPFTPLPSNGRKSSSLALLGHRAFLQGQPNYSDQRPRPSHRFLLVAACVCKNSELTLSSPSPQPTPCLFSFSVRHAPSTTGALQLACSIFHRRRILSQETKQRSSRGTYLWSRWSRGRRRRRLDGCDRAQDADGEGGG